MDKQINSLGIDVNTESIKTIINRLKRLKSTIEIINGGHYIHCPECSQILIKTILTEDQLDHWLWKNNMDYIGTFKTKNI